VRDMSDRDEEEVRLRAFAWQALHGETKEERALAASMLLYAALSHCRASESHWRQLEEERAEWKHLMENP
jgi:hypothetical protein